MTRGRNATVLGWLEHLGEATVATDAALSLTASYAHITQGEGAKSEHWAAVAATLLDAEAASEQKTVLTAGLGLIEATLARGGVGAIADHTALAAEMLPGDSPWMSMCRLIEGVGLHLRGLREEAREKLVDGARRGAVGAPNVQVLCLSQMALLAIEENDWTLAEMLASQARAQVDRSGLGDYPIMALVLAVSALVRSRTGRVEEAAADLRRGAGLLERLEEFAPWYVAETLVALARAAARLDDAPAATRMLAEATRVLEQTPDAVVLGEWIEATARAIETVSASAPGDLTPAELRVLQFLPTHLSFPEIAGQVFVSPNTVKTQAQGVYRKLGVSSRREAVERARAAGLLDAGRFAQETTMISTVSSPARRRRGRRRWWSARSPRSSAGRRWRRRSSTASARRGAVFLRGGLRGAGPAGASPTATLPRLRRTELRDIALFGVDPGGDEPLLLRGDRPAAARRSRSPSSSSGRWRSRSSARGGGAT